MAEQVKLIIAVCLPYLIFVLMVGGYKLYKLMKEL